MNKINVVCLYHGSAYDIEYVINLKSAVLRWLKTPHEFHIMTDREDQYVALSALGNVIPLPKATYNKAWWHKLYMFSLESGLSGTCLYFDLDVIALGELDCFIAQTDCLHIIHDFNRVHHNNINLSNSSIVSWPHQRYRYLWQQFSADPARYHNTMPGDQDFIHKYVTDKQWYAQDLAVSYRWEYLTNKLYGPNTRMLVLHGKPKPHELADPKLLAQWRVSSPV
jgi:hypothetical protein